MITAYFQTSGSVKIPALVPDGDLLDLAATMGLSESDLFSVEVPSGATRWTRIRVLIAQDKLATLYGSQVVGQVPSASFHWGTDAASLMQGTFYLLPPKPVFMVANGAGVALVEAVCERWFWAQTQLNALSANPLRGPLFSADGRWNTTVASANAATPLALMNALVGSLTNTVNGISVGSYNPDSSLLDRVADHLFTPECSVGMAMDLLAAGTGFVWQRDMGSTHPLILTDVGGDASELNSWMTTNKVAYVGGASAPSNAFTVTEPLANLWYGLDAYQVNALPASVTVSYPYRTVEGKTRYNNTDTDTTTLMFSSEKEFGWQNAITTGRTRGTNGTRLTKEPRPLVASSTPGLNPGSPASSILGSTAPSWNYAAYNAQVAGLMAVRASVMPGKIGWAGWVAVPLGSFRCTMVRYSLARRRGEIVPVTVTECDSSDWLLGPDGMLPCDPKDITLSKGMSHVRRLWSGATMTDTAPPNTRVFLALITGNSPICSGWKWSYTFSEREPSPNITCPMSVPLTPFNRTGTARNVIEDSNNPQTGVIAPGIAQTDYPNATITPLPIPPNTLVMMVEQFPAISNGSTQTVPVPQYWFVMANAVRVECTEEGGQGGV
jgi:hypothetical protein